MERRSCTVPRMRVMVGMTGKLCMRRDQATIVNAELSPTSAEVLWAQDVIEALGEDGAHVEGRSDLPRLNRARKITTLARVFIRLPLTRSPDVADDVNAP